MYEILIGLFVLAIGFALAVLLPILSFARASDARRRAEAAERRVRDLEGRIHELSKIVESGRQEASRPAPPPTPATAAIRPESAEPPLPIPSVPARPGPAPAATASAAAPVPRPMAPLAQPTLAETQSATPPRPRTPAADSLETRIGSNWLLYIGLAAILVGASYFVKYAIDNQWLNETARILLGSLTGIGFIAAGLRFVSTGYQRYGQALAGTGVALLFLCVYAAHAFYALIGRPAAFLLMTGVTVLGAVLADVQKSQPLALTAVIGGFFVPFLVGGESDTPIPLFSYDLALVAATLYLARRRSWPALDLASFLLTVGTVVAWIGAEYERSDWLVLQIFLTAFAAMFIVIWRETRRMPGPSAQVVSLVLGATPVLYHVASLANLSTETLPLLVYLIVVDVAALLWLGREASSSSRLLVWVAVVAPYFLWLLGTDPALWFAAGIVALLALYFTHLTAQIDAVLVTGRAPDDAGVAGWHLNALALASGGYLLLASRYLALTGAAAVAVAIWHGALAWWVVRRSRETAHHFIAIAGAFLASAVALEADGPWVVAAWATEAAGVIWLGLRERRSWLQRGAAVLMCFAILRLIDLLLSPVPVGYLTLLNTRVAAGAFVVAALFLLARLYREDAPGVVVAAPRTLALVTANLLVLLVVSTEIDAFWTLRDAGRGGYLAKHTLWSITWAIYAAGLIVAGIRRRLPPLRYLAFAIFGIAVLKVAFVDLAALERIYRILSVVVLGLLLVVTSYLYQRYAPALEAGESGRV